MKNIVLCFDRARHHPGPREASNAEALLRLLEESDEQITWYHPGTPAPASERGQPGQAAVARGRRQGREGHDRRGIRISRRLVGARRQDLHLRRRPRRLVRPRADPAPRHRRRAARPDGLCAGRLCRAAHTPQPPGLAASHAAGGTIGRAPRNRRSRTVFGALGHGEGAGSAGDGRDERRRGQARGRGRRRQRFARRSPC